jgi:hypothetical protein
VRLTVAPAGSQSGPVLVANAALVAVMLISALAIVTIGSQDTALAMRDAQAAAAFYLAEAGVERGQTWLTAQSSAPGDTLSPFGDGPDVLGIGTYAVMIEPNGDPVRTVYTVRSVGNVGGETRAIEIDVRSRTFLDYLYFTNQDAGPGGTMNFTTEQTVDGPVHTNGQIRVWGDPAFAKTVESVDTEVRYYNNGFPLDSSAPSNPPHDQPDWQCGYALGVPSIDWLEESDMAALAGAAEISLTGDYDIAFSRPEGLSPLIGYLSYSEEGMGDWTDVPLDSFNGIVHVDGDANVWGTVDGEVTVATSGDIYVADDLVYHDRNGDEPSDGCDDIVGLAATDQVIVAETAPNATDCVIHAHVLAINNQGCIMENYNLGSPRGTLTLHGGVAQDKWGPVGIGYVMDGRLIVLTGYRRDFHYDARFMEMMPPGYDLILNRAGTYYRIAWRDLADG